LKETKNDKENIYQELIKQMKEVQEQNKELKDELLKMKNITMTNSNNTINCNTITNNSISLVAFGKEDLSYISNNIYKKIFASGSKSVLEFISHIHFNENKPEHSNVYISNIRDKYAMIYDGNKWILKDQTVVIGDLFENNKDNIIDKFEDLFEKLSERIINKFYRFINKEDNDKLINSIKQEIRLLLYNKKEIPLNIRKGFKNVGNSMID
jgi:hypothetical protein